MPNLDWNDYFNNDRESGAADLAPGEGRAIDRFASGHEKAEPKHYDPSEGCTGPEFGFCGTCCTEYGCRLYAGKPLGFCQGCEDFAEAPEAHNPDCPERLGL